MNKPIIMKYIFLLFFAFSSLANAQGDLQFNQIVEVDLYHAQEDSGWNANAQKTHEVQVTIPEGKVWKINSVSVGFFNDGVLRATPSYIEQFIISVNDIGLFNLTGYQYAYNNFVPNVFPKWLPSGDHTFQLNYIATSTTYDASEVKAQISGIEFNIIQ